MRHAPTVAVAALALLSPIGAPTRAQDERNNLAPDALLPQVTQVAVRINGRPVIVTITLHIQQTYCIQIVGGGNCPPDALNASVSFSTTHPRGLPDIVRQGSVRMVVRLGRRGETLSLQRQFDGASDVNFVGSVSGTRFRPHTLASATIEIRSRTGAQRIEAPSIAVGSGVEIIPTR